MSRAFYRISEPTLQRSAGPLPRWVKPLVVSVVAAVTLVIASRAVTVATMEDPGPPPSVPASVPAP